LNPNFERRQCSEIGVELLLSGIHIEWLVMSRLQPSYPRRIVPEG